MPQIKSAIKRVKTQEATRKRKAAQTNRLRTTVKKFRVAATSGTSADTTKLQVAADRALDKAVSKGLIHKNKAARDKSRLAKLAANNK